MDVVERMRQTESIYTLVVGGDLANAPQFVHLRKRSQLSRVHCRTAHDIA